MVRGGGLALPPPAPAGRSASRPLQSADPEPLPLAGPPEACHRCKLPFSWLWRRRCRCEFCGNDFCGRCTRKALWLATQPGAPPVRTCYGCKASLDPDGDGYPTAEELNSVWQSDDNEPSPLETLDADALLEAADVFIDDPASPDLYLTPPVPPAAPAAGPSNSSRPSVFRKTSVEKGDDDDWVQLRKWTIQTLPRNKNQPRKPQAHRQSIRALRPSTTSTPVEAGAPSEA